VGRFASKGEAVAAVAGKGDFHIHRMAATRTTGGPRVGRDEDVADDPAGTRRRCRVVLASVLMV
jgi:hypothetical protein